jgi:hypothetical protein
VKQQKLRKGIIYSDEDEADERRKVEQIEEGDDDDEGSSSSADVEDFIVPDNGDIDDEELARAARMMPSKPDCKYWATSYVLTLTSPFSPPFGACCTQVGGPFPHFCKLGYLSIIIASQD